MKARQLINSRHYHKRKKRLQIKGGEKGLKEAYERNEIDEKEYKKLLIGGAKIQFQKELKIKEKMEKAKEKSRRVYEQLEARIAQLNQDLEHNTNPEIIHQLNEQLEKYNAVLGRLRETTQRTFDYEDHILAIYTEIPHWYGTVANDFAHEATPANLLKFARLRFPEAVHKTTYYYYAALCTPMIEWRSIKPWTDHVYCRIAGSIEEILVRKQPRTLLKNADCKVS